MHRCDNEVRRALLIYKGIKESLPSLIHFIQSQEKANQIKRMIGHHGAI
ncbi:YkoP family protein [Lederbergia citrisecunda]